MRNASAWLPPKVAGTSPPNAGGGPDVPHLQRAGGGSDVPHLQRAGGGPDAQCGHIHSHLSGPPLVPREHTPPLAAHECTMCYVCQCGVDGDSPYACSNHTHRKFHSHVVSMPCCSAHIHLACFQELLWYKTGMSVRGESGEFQCNHCQELCHVQLRHIPRIAVVGRNELITRSW